MGMAQDWLKILSPQSSPGQELENGDAPRHPFFHSLERFEKWQERVEQCLYNILEELKGEETDRAHIPGNAVSAGASVDIDLVVPPLGESWIVERITATITNNGVNNPGLMLFIDNPDDIRLIAQPALPVIAAGTSRYSDAAPGNLWIPPMTQRLIARFTGLQANANVAITLQVAKNKHTPKQKPSRVNPG